MTLIEAIEERDIKAVKQHLTTGANVNVKVASGQIQGNTAVDAANKDNHTETAALLRKHGGKTVDN